jgi:CBS domain-containing protein
MLARDIMRENVVTVTPQMTLKEVAKLFSRRGISGAPVVGTEGKLIGVISQTDLIEQNPEPSPLQPSTRRRRNDADAKASATRRRSPSERRVEHAMTPYGVSLEEDTPVRELARQMLAKRIHRVVITRAGEICGIVTSMDMLRALVGMMDAAVPQRSR